MSTKYKLVWWEDNGYDDSYFYGVSFDTVDGKLHKESLGSTAYSGGIGFDGDFLEPTPEVLELARKELVKVIFSCLREAEHCDVLTPGPRNVQKGRRFRLLEPHSFYLKAPVGCPKCNGSGKWVNPSNQSDARACFGCGGHGVTVGTEFLKDASGKRVKQTMPVGLPIVAEQGDAVFFGRQFRNGYNRPNRDNASVATFVAGQKVLVPLAKLRQDAEPLSDEELMKRAEELSHGHRYEAVFGCKGWASRNWAAELAGRSE